MHVSILVTELLAYEELLREVAVSRGTAVLNRGSYHVAIARLESRYADGRAEKQSAPRVEVRVSGSGRRSADAAMCWHSIATAMLL